MKKLVFDVLGVSDFELNFFDRVLRCKGFGL